MLYNYITSSSQASVRSKHWSQSSLIDKQVCIEKPNFLDTKTHRNAIP